VRAVHPDRVDHVVRDGVRLGYEVFGGDGDPTILLMPTWTIIHSRFWKMQVPYLSRRFRVITYDGPGNGLSDRVTDPARYALDSYAADAEAVLDACGVERAVIAGLSLGAAYSVRFAALYPARVSGLVLIGSSMPLAPRHPERTPIDEMFEPCPPDPQGWQKYNVAYWHAHHEDFLEFFFEQCFNEPHSTKPREDAVGWGTESTPSVLEAEARKPPWQGDPLTLFDDVDCPVLVIHGTRDRISPHQVAVEAARLSNGTLMSMVGSGHIPNVRDPVPINLAIRDFVESISQIPEPSHAWHRGSSRRKRALFLSSPIGLGHARRDLAIAEELRALAPDLEIDWLAQHPVTAVLGAAGEAVHPASEWLASESGHIASEAAGHELHCFQALRRMDEILVANFMIFQEVVDEGDYDLVIGDEAWDVDYYWHENPELKRGSHVWLTDFVGYLPMPDGGDHEAHLTADYNAEMIEHIARYPRIRDRAIFVGNPDDIYPEVFGPGLPKITDWTKQHFDFAGYITGFVPPTEAEAEEWRAELGYAPDEKVCIVTVGGSGVGHDLLETVIAAYPHAKELVPELRMVAVAGPRIDPESLSDHPGLEVHGYVDRLYRHLSVCDVAVVQGGMTTTMELTAARRPFLYFPLINHFEQNFHVRHRLDQYRAGRHMDYRHTDPEELAAALAAGLGRPVNYRSVETDGAARAARMISELL
jgi:pimeloyl-ACP methyl ester carboxylesterase/predicted glycosyltransferase